MFYFSFACLLLTSSSQLCKFFTHLYLPLLLPNLHHRHLPHCAPVALSVSCLNDIKTQSPDRRWKKHLSQKFFPTPMFCIWLLSICKQKGILFFRLQIRFCLFEWILILLFFSGVIFIIRISPEMVFPMSAWIQLLALRAHIWSEILQTDIANKNKSILSRVFLH